MNEIKRRAQEELKAFQKQSDQDVIEFDGKSLDKVQSTEQNRALSFSPCTHFHPILHPAPFILDPPIFHLLKPPI